MSFHSGVGWEFAIVDPDDQRVSGTMRNMSNSMKFLDGFEDLATTSTRIDNGAGSWVGFGQMYNYTGAGATDYAFQAVLHGTEAYEGLSLHLAQPAMQEPVTGVIFPGEMPIAPEIPEPASTE